MSERPDITPCAHLTEEESRQLAHAKHFGDKQTIALVAKLKAARAAVEKAKAALDSIATQAVDGPEGDIDVRDWVRGNVTATELAKVIVTLGRKAQEALAALREVGPPTNGDGWPCRNCDDEMCEGCAHEVTP